jgi:hypothetical protein
MTFLSFEANNVVTLPVRDWQNGNDALTGYGVAWRVQMVLYSKDGRTITTYNVTSPTFDKYTREFTFTYSSVGLEAEVPYMIRLAEQTLVTEQFVNTKILCGDRFIMLPQGKTISTYQPVLATVEEAMNNTFKIYGHKQHQNG